jgi:hypothetical protein
MTVGFRGDLGGVYKFKKGEMWDFVGKRGMMWDNRGLK